MPKLSKFNKNESNTSIKHILIAFGIIICLLAAFGIYRTHAIYTTNGEYDVIRSKIGDFSKKTIDCTGMLLKDCIIALSEIDESVVQQTQPTTTQTGSNATTDYRYIGADPDNYVCLETSGVCTEDQLYRIIGVIPTQKVVNGIFEYRVKLIKSSHYVGSTAIDYPGCCMEGKGYFWHSSSNNGNNDWTTSLLNKDVLNSTTNGYSYWQSISAYHKYIDDTVWYLGASSIVSPQNFYMNERGTVRGNASGPNNYRTTTKIGLMYASDYGYATSGGNEEQRSTCLSYLMSKWSDSSYDFCRDNDWLRDLYGAEWSIVSSGDANFLANYMSGGNSGGIGNGPTYNYNPTSTMPRLAIRPVFNLASNVKYNGGTGEHDNPYLISL